MIVFKDVASLQEFLNKNNKNKTIGFVPTMGALHKGHLSLLEKAKVNNDVVIASIFVNPTQFNKAEDLKKYPRDLKTDLNLLKKIGCNIVFTPSVSEMYPKGEVSKQYDFNGLEYEMEGKFRPGHFNGVVTIVMRLFDIIKPTKAYFGEKDFQQLLIIKKMEEKAQKPVSIISCPIYREPNGLATSSRNERLSITERKKANIIYKTLCQVKSDFEKKPLQDIYNDVENLFKAHSVFDLEYFIIADVLTLKPTEMIDTTKKYRAFISVYANKIRLIDNVAL